jgi:hypothetical protein
MKNTISKKSYPSKVKSKLRHSSGNKTWECLFPLETEKFSRENSNENVSKLNKSLCAYTIRECIQCHWIVHFKMANFI